LSTEFFPRALRRGGGTFRFLTAIALLYAAGGDPFTLRLTGGPASPAYLDMTLRMLEHAGVRRCVRPAQCASRACRTRGDHRLVMAGFLLSMITASVQVEKPWAATRTCSAFRDHAREAGRSVLAVDAQ
jgi:5-enolpyruvylshikimate-3-phosphate synthase